MSIDAAPGPRKGPGAKPRATGWRAERPLWGAVVCIAGAIELYSVTMAPLSVVVMQGLPGLATLAIAALTIILSILTLAQPHLRSITGWMIIIMGILSVLVSNLGGFVVGMILLVVGGSLLLAWEEPAGSAPPAPVAGAAADDPVAGGPAAPARPVRPPAGRNPVAGGTPGSRPPRPAQGRPRSKGLAGVIETMTGGSGRGRPPQKRPPAKKPANGAGKGGGAKGAGAANGARRQRSTPLPTSGDGISSGPPGEQRPARPRPVELSPPDDPPAARARTWILVPLLVGALSATALGAAPANAFGGSARTEGPLDWLFPPSTPSPAPPAPVAPAPAPSPTQSNGLTLPSLPNLFPQPSASATPSASASAPAAECEKTGLPDGRVAMGSEESLEIAGAMKACADAQAAAEQPVTKAAEAGVPVVSNRLTTLKAKALIMNGLSYDGLSTLDSPAGPVEAMKFSADTIELEQMDQSYPFPGGTISIKNNDASGKAKLDGEVEMYVTKLTGKIFGLVELTFTPSFQPPLVTPFLIMTDTTSEIAFVKANQILLPALTNAAN